MNDKTINISIQLEEYVVNEIKNSLKSSNQETKVAPWIRRVIYRTLNIPMPVYSFKNDPYVDLRHINKDKLSSKLKLLVELWNKGYTLAEMTTWLTERNVPTLRSGSTWTRTSVLSVLRNISKRQAKKQEKEILDAVENRVKVK